MPDKPKRPESLLDWLGVTNAPNWWVARPLGSGFAFALGLLFALALIAAFVVVGMAIAKPETAGFGTGALIVAILGAPFAIWGTVLKHQTVRYQKEGHITDRITAAVEQLGADKTVKDADGERSVPNIEVRIGAILSLERIAQDSTIHDNGRDHVRVMEILCAYVRENSNARKPVDFPLPEWEPLPDDSTSEDRAVNAGWQKARFKKWLGGRGDVNSWTHALPKPRADVALALKVLGRRTSEQRLIEAAWPEPPDANTVWPFDIPCPYLPDDPQEEALSKEELDAYLAKLRRWEDEIEDYSGYCLDLEGANLQRVTVPAKRTDLSGAVFAGALLARARMEGAMLIATRLEGAFLAGARMEGAFINAARMDAKTNVMDAVLTLAAVEAVDLSKVPISETQLKSMFGDASVILPDGMERPAHWPDWELPGTAFFDEWREWQRDPANYTPPPKPDTD